jgi:outer membrane receptor for Fe3+-dicitrate
LHQFFTPWPFAWEATFGIAYGYLYSRNSSNRTGETGNELPFRPPHRLIPSLLVRWPAQNLQIKFWATYEDRTFTDLLNTPDQIARAHWLANARAEWGIGTWAERQLPTTLGAVLKSTSLFVEANNIADIEFGVPGPLTRLAGRRSLLVGIHVQQ